MMADIPQDIFDLCEDVSSELLHQQQLDSSGFGFLLHRRELKMATPKIPQPVTRTLNFDTENELRNAVSIELRCFRIDNGLM